MKKLFTLVSVVTLLTGFSVAYGEGLPVEGTWGMAMDQNEFHFDMSMKIQNQTITMTNVCSFHGQNATAAVTVQGQYDATSIALLQNAHQEVSQNGLNCDVNVQAGRMNYVIQGNSLILTRDGYQEQITLTRR